MPKNPSSGSFDGPPSTDTDDQPIAGERRGSHRSAAGAGGNGGADTRPAEARSADQPSSGNGGAQADSARGRTQGGRQVGERKKQFLIAPRTPAAGGLHALGFMPLSLSNVEQALRASPDIEVVDTVGPRNVVGMLADGMGGSQGILVARMTEQKAGALYQQGQGRLLVERDQSLALLDAQPALRPAFVSSVLPSGGPAFTAQIAVVDKDGNPVSDCEVSLFGSMLPATSMTDASGQATLSLYGETAASISGLYVKPKADYWSYYSRDPDISPDEPNVVVLRALSDWHSLSGFPRQRAVGWGQRAMRMDQLPPTYRGQGIKIAVIDSGIANSHDCLKGVRAGFDIVNKKTNPNSWNEDTLGHGSHCAGVIGAAELAYGIRGFAPDAEIHACKLFPGGQVSQLIDALEYCIEKQIDVVNLSLGGAEPSEALEQQIQRAKRAGIACIVAAGNSGGPVQYPASSPNVLAVSAIGKLDEFPPDSYHAQTIGQDVDANGFFSATFSCAGPQVDVCGPGVAITSTVPPNNYAAWDGTSMAAPHITGLAALVLAHHPEFQTVFKMRGPERVERLFQHIRMSARRVSRGDPSRVGFGLPDAIVAVGLQAPQFAQAMAAQAMSQQPVAAGGIAAAGAPGAMAGVGASGAVGDVGGVTGARSAPGMGIGQGSALETLGLNPAMAAISPFGQPAVLGQALGVIPGMPFGIAAPGFINRLW